MRSPKVTIHDIETIQERIRRTGSLFLPEWRPKEGEPGWSVAQLFARMQESLGDEADKLPEKLFVAYLDAFGFSQRPAVAATAPVVFEPAPKFRGSVTIPKGTALESETKVRYETDRDITVTSAKLGAFLETDPERNEVTDYTQEILDAERIRFFTGGSPVPQYLYFGDDDLFRIHRFRGDPDAYLKIVVPLSDAAEWSYWGVREGSERGEWLPFVWHGNRLNKKGNTRTIRREIGGAESYWIRAKLTGPVTPLHDYAVTFKSRSGVDALYHNDVAIDPTRTIYPFGRLPQRNDTFYIAASEAFSKRGAIVGVDFGGWENPEEEETQGDKEEKTHKNRIEFQKDGSLKIGDGVVTFEYFDGSSWKPLRVERYDAAHPWAERACDFSFRVPWDLRESSVNGDKNLWIRCRLVGGRYTCTKGNPDVEFSPPIFDHVDLYVREYRRRPAHLLREAHGNVEDLLEGETKRFFPISPLHFEGLGIVKERFTPSVGTLLTNPGGKRVVEGVEVVSSFRKLERLVTPLFPLVGPGKWRHPYAQLSDEKALYLGFDRPFGEGVVSILWVAEEELDAERIVTWSYSSDEGSWRRLPLQDGTEGCSKRGYLLFIAPQNQRKRRLFGKELYWLKAIFPPETKGVGCEGFYLNAVSVTQCQSVEREIVGSSDGTVFQRFTVANTPAFDLRVEILESEAPEGLSFREDPFSDGVWVLWERVDDLRMCGADERCYRFDPERGEILFGDGTHGMIPPIGRNTVAASYRFGGGGEGNCPAEAIRKTVDSLAHIRKLFNPLPAEGGAERESLASLMRHAPLRMKHGGRAVRREDYEALVMEASGDVAKVAVDTGPGRVDLYLLPRSAENRPVPNVMLIRNVTERIVSRAPATTAIGIHPPVYVPVGVAVELLVREWSGAARLSEEVRQRLERYFHPLFGRGGTGWRFGQSPSLSGLIDEIGKIIVGAVVAELTLRIDVPGNDLWELSLGSAEVPPFGPGWMVCSDDHTISVRGR